MVRVRKLSAALLGLSCLSLTLSLALPYWHCGYLLDGCIHNDNPHRNEMMAVAALLILGLACLFPVFLIEAIRLCMKTVPCGMVTARFVLLYIGALSAFCGSLLYTCLILHRYAYFFAIFGATVAFVVQKLTMISSRCITQPDS